jgi:hypothetical protein
MRRHRITVPAAVWSVLASLTDTERDRVLASALAPNRGGTDPVQVRDLDDHSLAPCSPARARQLVRRGTAQWVSYTPPVIRLTRRQSPHTGEAR